MGEDDARPVDRAAATDPVGDATLPADADPALASTLGSDAGSSGRTRGGGDPTRIDHFRVLRRLGEGGMGVVFAALDEELEREVAIKLLQGDPGSPRRRARLLREARAMAKLAHPNVVAVHEVGMYGDEVYVAMELVAGTTLRRWLDVQRRKPDEILDVFVQAGRGLAAAHAIGLVHRDFKPDNVMIGTDGRVRVLDFGLARAATDDEPVTEEHGGDGPVRLTVTGAVLGTPAYMSPEQHRGEPADVRSDQFAFCVSLWESLFAQRPFAGDTLPALTTSVLEGRLVEPPRDARLPRRIVPALRRGLARDAGERFASMDALIDELRPRTSDGSRSRIAAPALVGGVLAFAAVGAYVLGPRREQPAAESSGAEEEHAHEHEHEPPRATAMTALREITSGPTASEQRHRAEAWLGRHGTDASAAERAVAHATIGHVRWEQSCMTPKTAGVCARREPLTADSRRCQTLLQGLLAVEPRDAEQVAAARRDLDTAAAAFAQAEVPEDPLDLEAFQNARGALMVDRADALLEDYLRLAPAPASVHAVDQSAFTRWVDDKSRALDAVLAAYHDVESSGSTYWTVVAGARSGVALQDFADRIVAVPLPRPRVQQRETVCRMHLDLFVPRQQQAWDAFERCANAAREHGLSDEYVMLCQEHRDRVASLDRELIQSGVTAQNDRLRACYEAELARNRDATGRIVMRWTILRDGRVKSPVVESNELGSQALAKCVAATVETMRFSPPEMGDEKVITYPFVFTPE